MSRYGEKEQVLILKLFDYFQREKDAGKTLLPLAAVYERVSDALGVSCSTIQRIKSKGIEKDEDFKNRNSLAILSSRKRPLHEIHEHTIRERIYEMFIAGEVVTIGSLQQNLELIDGVKMSTGSLSECLKKLKFKFLKCTVSNRLLLIEQPHIAQKRLEFLREFKNNENSQVSLKPVFLDETWIYSKGASKRSWGWQGDTTVKKKTSEGVRYNILNAGSENGFVNNASLVLKCGQKPSHNHSYSMNTENFEKWFKDKLLPNLQEPSLIIMDNAACHSGLIETVPNITWSKKLLMGWLEERQIPFPPTAMKDEIWKIVNQYIPAKRYRLDELALQQGHRVLRVPPNHDQFNAINLVWSECKRYYDAKISSIHPVTNDTVLGLWNEALSTVTSEKWNSYVKDTIKIINDVWEREKCIDSSDILPHIVNYDESDLSDDND